MRISYQQRSTRLEVLMAPSRRDALHALAGLGLAPLAARPAWASCDLPAVDIDVERLVDGPIIHAGLDPSIGTNIQGPSLIRTPDWLPNRMGRYYLYFADHKGSYIRLAYADDVEGPWSIHAPGSLHLPESNFLTERPPVPEGRSPVPPREGVPSPADSAVMPHIASPDVHVRDDRREIVMYFHGLAGPSYQRSRVAWSTDGIRFTASQDLIGRSYMRAFRHESWWYVLAMPGIFYRSRDGMPPLEEGPTLFEPDMRHAAVHLRGDTLFVFWSRAGDAPEHILASTIDVSGDWRGWRNSTERSLLKPERPWEGAGLPIEPSVRDAVNVRVNQLRDPAIHAEDGRVYLLYAIAGEAGIGLARLDIRC